MVKGGAGLCSTVRLGPLTSFPFVYEWASIWGKAHAATVANSC